MRNQNAEFANNGERKLSRQDSKEKLCWAKILVKLFSLFVSQVGRLQQEKNEFWELIEEELARAHSQEGLLLSEDVNVHFGSVRDRYEDVMGPYRFADKKPERDKVLSLFKNHELKVVNTIFKKDREKLRKLSVETYGVTSGKTG